MRAARAQNGGADDPSGTGVVDGAGSRARGGKRRGRSRTKKPVQGRGEAGQGPRQVVMVLVRSRSASREPPQGPYRLPGERSRTEILVYDHSRALKHLGDPNRAPLIASSRAASCGPVLRASGVQPGRHDSRRALRARQGQRRGRIALSARCCSWHGGPPGPQALRAGLWRRRPCGPRALDGRPFGGVQQQVRGNPPHGNARARRRQRPTRLMP